MNEQSTAILVVSFGSTHLDTLEKCIAATEQAIAESFPECPVYRAFLSNTVIKRLQAKHGLHMDTVEEALTAIWQDGYKQVVVQPTLLLGGIEFDILQAKLKAENRLKVVLGRPLIEHREDCEALAEIIMNENPLEDQEALLLMGHGTDHKANDVYSELQDVFAERGYCCFIGTVEGNPSFEDGIKKLVQCGALRARLLPLLFVAGDHAKNDMAGKEDSLYAQVTAAGLEGMPIVRGLGESEAVRRLYVRRIEDVFEETKGWN